jgi:hypothetical protein
VRQDAAQNIVQFAIDLARDTNNALDLRLEFALRIYLHGK